MRISRKSVESKYCVIQERVSFAQVISEACPNMKSALTQHLLQLQSGHFVFLLSSTYNQDTRKFLSLLEFLLPFLLLRKFLLNSSEGTETRGLILTCLSSSFRKMIYTVYYGRKNFFLMIKIRVEKINELKN